jgi:hypothetical protein
MVHPEYQRIASKSGKISAIHIHAIWGEQSQVGGERRPLKEYYDINPYGYRISDHLPLRLRQHNTIGWINTGQLISKKCAVNSKTP